MEGKLMQGEMQISIEWSGRGLTEEVTFKLKSKG